MNFIVNIRERRQITLPAAVLDRLNLNVGDRLAIQVSQQKLVAKPLKKQVIDTLQAIQEIFRKAKMTEAELQKAGRDLRKKLVKEIYG